MTASRAFLLRSGATASPVPPGVESLDCTDDDRSGAARRIHLHARAARVVVLYAEESVSEDLAAELAAAPDDAARVRAYRAPMQVELLGRSFATTPTVLAWDGDPASSGPVVDCRGSVVVRFRDLHHAIAALDDRARRAAAGRDRAAVGEFLWRPAAAFVRRCWRRRHTGTAGFIMSVLQTYGEVLTAAKVWERTSGRRRSAMIPAAFRRHESPGCTLAVRDDVGPELERVLATATPDFVEGGRRLAAGRGGTWAVRAADAPPAILRWYRRGGVPSRIARDRFVAAGTPRPLRELAVTEAARARGISVPTVLAIRVDDAGLARYRGLIVTREIEGGVALDRLLDDVGGDAQAVAVRATARAVRRMHDRGLHHPDLNAANVMLVRRGEAYDVCIIDLDRARLRATVSRVARRRALRRLDRSLARLASTSAELRTTMQRVYWETR